MRVVATVEAREADRAPAIIDELPAGKSVTILGVTYAAAEPVAAILALIEQYGAARVARSHAYPTRIAPDDLLDRIRRTLADAIASNA